MSDLKPEHLAAAERLAALEFSPEERLGVQDHPPPT